MTSKNEGWKALTRGLNWSQVFYNVFKCNLLGWPFLSGGLKTNKSFTSRDTFQFSHPLLAPSRPFSALWVSVPFINPSLLLLLFLTGARSASQESSFSACQDISVASRKILSTEREDISRVEEDRRRNRGSGEIRRQIPGTIYRFEMSRGCQHVKCVSVCVLAVRVY